MTARHTPITLDTIASVRAAGYRLVAHCQGCGRHQPLDLDELVARLGPDAPAVRRRWPLRCSGCGGRDGGVLVMAPDRGPVATSSN